jgi:hypothetical protein
LERRQNNNLPDLNVYSEIGYISSSQDTTNTSPDYELGFQYFMPINDRDNAILEDIEKIKLNKEQLLYESNKFEFHNKVEAIAQALKIKKNNLDNINEMRGLYKKKQLFEKKYYLKKRSQESLKWDEYFSSLENHMSKADRYTKSLDEYKSINNTRVNYFHELYIDYFKLKHSQIQ